MTTSSAVKKTESKISCFTFFKLPIALCLLLLGSCSGIQKISNVDLSFLYRQNSLAIDADFFIYHFTNDSSRLCLKIPVKNIFYKQNDAGVMESQLQLKMLVFPSYEVKKLTDSLIANFKIAYSTDSTSYVLKSFLFKKPVAENCVVQILLKDINRNTTVGKIIELTNSRQSAESFLVIDELNDIPVFSNHFGENKKLKIICNNATQPLFVQTWNCNFPLSIPPFSDKKPQAYSYAVDSNFVFTPSGAHTVFLDKKAMYYLQYDTLQKSGRTLMRFNDDFPAITNAAELTEVLRYITTHDEYQQLLKSENKKEAIDKFWLELSGSKERARFLIKAYYSRAQKANCQFTSYLEGWKSDRGMIYIVFGPPRVVYRSNEGEYWDYGSFPGYGNLSFSFKKVKNPFTHNDYALIRQPYYKPVWYLSVENWRHGRVRTEAEEW